MTYGLPSRGQQDWDDELNNSIEALKATADAAAADATVARSNATAALNATGSLGDIATALDAAETAASDASASAVSAAGAASSASSAATTATTKATEAAASAAAAQAVGTTNDAIIASRIADSTSATASALSASIDARAQTNAEVLAPWFRVLKQDPASAKIALVGDSTYDSAAAGLNLHNAIKAQFKTGLPLEGMADANVLNFGYNGQTTSQITSSAHMTALAAADPDLIIAGPGINDIRATAYTTAQLRAILVAGFEAIRAACPGVPIIASMPNSFLTTDVGSVGYVSPNGDAQAKSTIMREAYLSLTDEWPDVIVVDTQAKVFGTTSLATSPYMGDQIHPNLAGMVAKVADLVTLIGYTRTRATGRSAAALVAAPYTPWTSYARDVEDPDRYELVFEATYQNQGSTFLDIDLPAGQRNRVRRGLIVALPSAQGSFQIPMTGGGFSTAVNGSYTRLLFSAGVIPANTVNGGKVRFYRQRYGGDSNLENVIKDTASWRFKRLFRVVSATATTATLAPVPTSATGTVDSAADLASIIAVGDQVYFEGNASSPTTLIAAQWSVSGSNIVLTSLATDYSTYTNRLVAIVGTHADAVPGPIGSTGPASGNASAVISGRDSLPTVMGTLTTSAGTNGNEYAIPFVPLANGTIDKLGVEVATGVAGAVARLGLRSSTGYLPDTVLVDAGTVDCSTTGYKQIAGLSQAVTAGTLYWLIVRLSGSAAANLKIINGISPLITYRDATAGEVGAVSYSASRGTTDGALGSWGSTYAPSNFAALMRVHML